MLFSCILRWEYYIIKFVKKKLLKNYGEILPAENIYPLSVYQDVTPLCEKGHVVLVRNVSDRNLYVKKQIRSYNPEVYYLLQNHPVKHTPVIYGIYEGPKAPEASGTMLTVIEEYLPGSTIAECLEERGIFSERETIDIAMKLCLILMELHGLFPSVIHRDIKPSNVMLTPEGDVKLLDFNAAKTENFQESRDTVLIGTAGFAAPEQYGFTTSRPQTDIYAVGVLINIMLIGKLPSEKMAGGKLRRIIRRCLEMNPKDRYGDVKELHHALNRAREMKVEWLPPGFRTLKLPKMILGCVVYGLVIALQTVYDAGSFPTETERILFRSALLGACLLLIAFYGDYMDIRRKFPFMRSPHKGVRLIGFLFVPFVLAWAVIVLVAIIKVIFLP